MVDTVLDAPKLLAVNSPIITNLLANDLVQTVHSKLGILTSNDCRIISEEGKQLPISLLGRLAKGTVVGVDAILECFGDRSEMWATAVVERFKTSDFSI